MDVPVESIDFYRALSVAVGKTHGHDDGLGKQFLWTTLLYMVLGTQTTDNFRARARLLGFLSPHLHLAECDEGLAVYTVADYQVSINILVPLRSSRLLALLHATQSDLASRYPDLSVDGCSLHDQMQGFELVQSPRHLVPTASHVKGATLADGAVECLGVRRADALVRIVDHAREALSYRPLTKWSRGDAEGTVYWHRFPCGTVALVTNPTLPRVAPAPLPPALADSYLMTLTASSSPPVQAFLRCLKPQSVVHAIEFLTSKTIPAAVRCMCVPSLVRRFGLNDTLIEIINEYVPCIADSRIPLLAEIHAFYVTVRVDDGVATAPELVGATFLKFTEVEIWCAWALRSLLFLSVARRVSLELFRRLSARHPNVRRALANVLTTSIGRWTKGEVEKAAALVDATPADEGRDGPARSVRAEFDRLQRLANDASAQMQREEDGRPPAAHKKKPPTHRLAKRRPPERSLGPRPSEAARRDPRTDPPTPSPTATHHGLVRRLRAQLLGGWACDLIGSGVFFRGGDVDVVIAVPDASTLDEAHARVRERTGWRPCYDSVSDDHVAVLSGTFEGVRVDAQVWRGREGCHAERETARALSLTRRLETDADAACRGNVATLHAVADAACLKGHRLCRLPGVAVTCVAVLLGRHAARALAPHELLSGLRDRLARLAPRFDFDDPHEENASAPARCDCPLHVVVQEVNVATRVTAAVTRHLLDAVAHALASPEPFATNAHFYEEWRAQHMIPCLRARPRADGARTVARTLHAALAQLDGHPLVDAAHVDEEACGESTALVLRVTLRADADAQRYGFRADDVVRRSGTGATVARAQRSWPLATLTHARAAVPWEERTTVASILDVHADGSLLVPNAPHLTVDAMALFDERQWELSC